MKKIIILALIATLFTGCVAKKSNENSGSSIETTTAQITTEETTTIIADTNEANPAETTAVTSQETKAVTIPKANETTTAPPSAPAKTVTITTVAVPRQTASKNVTITIPTTTKQPIMTTAPVTTSRAVSNNTSAFKQQVVDLVNAERAKVGLSALSIMPQAEAAAQIRATEIISSFSHTRPNGTSCFTALDEQGAKYMASGENIAAGQATPADVMNSWMNSPGHKANILNPKFTKIGIGYAEGGSYRTNWTQMFVG